MARNSFINASVIVHQPSSSSIFGGSFSYTSSENITWQVEQANSPVNKKNGQ